MGKGKKSEKIQINPTLPEFSKDKNSGEWTVSFSIECGNNLSYEIKYRFPEGPILESSDFLIPVCLIPAMKNQKILKIPGKVSKQLIQNVSIIQDIFRWWYSDYSIVKIETEEESQNQPQPSKRVACFFSLGVDSSYTLLKHLDEIGTLIFILGYDKKLTEETRLELSNTVKGIASSLRKNLIIVETNLRNFSNLYTDWGAEYYGAFLASVALLLSPQFKKIYIASAHTYKDLSAWGSHPILDQYWSNGLVQIAHDGCEASRIEKVALISKNDMIMQHLRVCWENTMGVYNCCKCEKCLRTMINLRAVGALERCRSFSLPLDPRLVARIKIDASEALLEFTRENLRAITQLKTEPALEKALRRCLLRFWRKKLSWKYFFSNIFWRCQLLKIHN